MTEPADESVALAGDVADEPDEIRSIVVEKHATTDPHAVVEWWGEDMWLFADTDAVSTYPKRKYKR